MRYKVVAETPATKPHLTYVASLGLLGGQRLVGVLESEAVAPPTPDSNWTR